MHTRVVSEAPQSFNLSLPEVLIFIPCDRRTVHMDSAHISTGIVRVRHHPSPARKSSSSTSRAYLVLTCHCLWLLIGPPALGMYSSTAVAARVPPTPETAGILKTELVFTAPLAPGGLNSTTSADESDSDLPLVVEVEVRHHDDRHHGSQPPSSCGASCVRLLSREIIY